MKKILVFCILLLLLPCTVSAKSIENQETKAVRFSLADGSNTNGEITVFLSDGSQVKLNESNGWEDYQMFILDGTTVERVSTGEFSGTLYDGEVLVTTDAEIPTSRAGVNPEYREVNKSFTFVWVLTAILVIAAGGIIFYLRKSNQ